MVDNLRELWHRSRKPRWWVDLLDENDNYVANLRGFTGGSLELGAQMDNGGNATLELREQGQSIDWLKNRARIWYDPGIIGIDPIAMATLLFTSPATEHTALGISYSVGMLTKMATLLHSPAGSYSVDAGVNIISTVSGLLAQAGQTRASITPSDATLSASMFWDPGTSYKQIINDLLAAAGYWSLFTDGMGTFQVAPYVNPADRSPAWTFLEDEYQLHTEEWTRDQDLSSVPNRVKLIQQGSDDTPALIGVAENLDPLSPFSYQSRGNVWYEHVEEGTDFATQAIGNQMAVKKLNDLMDPVTALQTKHAILPLIPNDVVEFPRMGELIRASILRVSYDLTSDSLASGEWREVTAVGSTSGPVMPL